ncbi:MAG: polysaccharide pyruvyl transferase CsaB [Armatimonadota bacterium]
MIEIIMNILLSGYYGYNNLGDEAVLGGIIAGLRAELPGVEPVVLSADPEGTRQLHGARAVPRMQLAAIRAALREADLFASGGGSLLQDVTSARSPLYYLGVLWLAQRAGVPTMALAQGMGPLNRGFNRYLTRTLLNRARAITVRDAGSAEFLQRIGVTRPPIEVTADPSFLLEPDASERLATWWDAHIPAGRPVVGVALRPWSASPQTFTAIADALAVFVQRTEALLLFLPMQFATDSLLAEEVARRIPAESRVLHTALTPREMLAAVGRCDLLVAMRLHALIFAAQRGIPAVGLAYDPKVRDFAPAAGLPDALPWESLTTGSLTAALLQSWETRAQLRDTITERAAGLRAKALRNIAVIGELLGG